MSVTLKLATSLDGRIATASGESRWITGEAAREQVHRLRAQHDAVVVGVETALADDPMLNVRLPDYSGRQPIRVVLDSNHRLPQTSKLMQTAGEIPVFLVGCKDPGPDTVDGCKAIFVSGPDDSGRVDLVQALEMMRPHGVNSLLVEGGGQVATSFLRCGLVDRIEWFRAPILLGGEGRPCVGALALERLGTAPRFRRVSAEPLGDDLWERYERL